MATLFATRDQASSAPLAAPLSALGLRADRTDISFENVTPDLVRVSVQVTNDGSLPSPATEVQVHVERQSYGMEAIVEFSLDRRAAGSGCYTV